MIKQDLINAYIAALNGTFLYDGEIIPCRDYSLMPNETPDFYILLTTYNEDTDTQTKCGNTWVGNLLVDVVTKFPAGHGNRFIANQIRSQVIPVIMSMQLTGLESTTIIEDTDLTMLTDAESVFRNLIRFEHRININ